LRNQTTKLLAVDSNKERRVTTSKKKEDNTKDDQERNQRRLRRVNNLESSRPNDDDEDDDYAKGNSCFPLSFRDVEDSIRPFSGNDEYPVEKWIQDFEDKYFRFVKMESITEIHFRQEIFERSC
jgi:hypothetical protein